jgi:hypothetical protein
LINEEWENNEKKKQNYSRNHPGNYPGNYPRIAYTI